jgi:hypothetical protein
MDCAGCTGPQAQPKIILVKVVGLRQCPLFLAQGESLCRRLREEVRQKMESLIVSSMFRAEQFCSLGARLLRIPSGIETTALQNVPRGTVAFVLALRCGLTRLFMSLLLVRGSLDFLRSPRNVRRTTLRRGHPRKGRTPGNWIASGSNDRSAKSGLTTYGTWRRSHLLSATSCDHRLYEIWPSAKPVWRLGGVRVFQVTSEVASSDLRTIRFARCYFFGSGGL